VPYKNKNGVLEAQFQAGWKGVQHMALRTGKYRYINVAPVYEGEEVIEDRITGSLKIEGVLTSPKREKGLIASFALLSGLQKSIYMTNEEMEDHGKKYSKGYTKSDGIWMTNKRAAYHKTILLKLLRTYGYLDPSDAAILEDEQAEVSDLELPEESEITIVERKPITTAEANKALGFGDEADEANWSTIEEPEFPASPVPVIETKPVEAGVLSIEAACKIVGLQQKRYIDMTIPELSKEFNDLNGLIKADKMTPEERALKVRNVKAVKMVIEAKRNKEI
jgi:recombinational DNA repair protein RecT